MCFKIPGFFKPGRRRNCKKGFIIPDMPTPGSESFIESIKSDMVLWWDMQDTGDTLTDLSGHNKDGTCHSLSNVSLNGRNWKQTSDGTGTVYNQSIPPLTNYSIGGVYYPTVLGDEKNYCRFFGFTDFKTELGQVHGNISMYPVEGVWSDSNYTPSVNVPIMVFLDCDGSNTYLYINGMKVKTWTGTHNTPSGTFYLLSEYSLGWGFVGYCGLGLIISKSLSESEHLQLFTEEKTKYGIA